MKPIITLVRKASKGARAARARIFRSSFQLGASTRILDLGSENGSNINLILQGTAIKAPNVYIADIDPVVINEGHERFGYVPVVIGETGKLPFDDAFFDIVYCSSVIEHVTVPKEDVWSLYSGHQFKSQSATRQQEFAREIRRLGKQYFVQTPYKHFPIESHSWLPFIAWLPRRLLIPLLRLTNLFWVKKTQPDWYLLDESRMRELFDDADIIYERKFGVKKSMMAIKVVPGSGEAASGLNTLKAGIRSPTP